MSADGQGVGVRAAATEATAARIVEAASRLFGEQLFDQVTLTAVARDAGVTVQTVIRRFGSKEELFSEVARRRSVELRSARDEAPVGDTTGAVALLLAGYERWGPEILHLLAQERRNPVIAGLLDEARRFHRDWIARVFAPQLACIDARDRRHELAKLVAVTDLYTWKVLRHDMGLDAEHTRTAIRQLAEAVTAVSTGRG
jgi:AcrR family transcriptional regulator